MNEKNLEPWDSRLAVCNVKRPAYLESPGGL